jgi:hypothetical protein
MRTYCYQCDEPTDLLSPRSRCANCEHKRAEFNANENDQLRNELVAVAAERDAALASIKELRHALLIVNETLQGVPARFVTVKTRCTMQRALETTPEGCALRVKFAALNEAIEKAEGSDSPMRELHMLAESYRGMLKP